MAPHHLRNLALGLVALCCIAFAGYVGLTIFQPGARDRIPIGGPFSLVDHQGREVTDATYKGRYLYLYFGYTFCPDVCPTELFDMTQALEAFAAEDPERAALVDPVFITVDPERDTPAVLRDYIANFHPRLSALTGSEAQIKAAVKAYRGYVKKQPSDDPEAYLVDHTSFIYLMGPDGYYLTHFNVQDDPATMAARLDEMVR